MLYVVCCVLYVVCWVVCCVVCCVCVVLLCTHTLLKAGDGGSGNLVLEVTAPPQNLHLGANWNSLYSSQVNPK